MQGLADMESVAFPAQIPFYCTAFETKILLWI